MVILRHKNWPIYIDKKVGRQPNVRLIEIKRSKLKFNRFLIGLHAYMHACMHVSDLSIIFRQNRPFPTIYYVRLTGYHSLPFMFNSMAAVCFVFKNLYGITHLKDGNRLDFFDLTPVRYAVWLHCRLYSVDKNWCK